MQYSSGILPIDIVLHKYYTYLMKYEIDLGNRIIECSLYDGHFYCSEVLSEGDFGQKITISRDDLRKTIKFPKVTIEPTSSGCKFTVRKKTKEERSSDVKGNNIKYRNKWTAENYERVSCILPKGTKERIASLGFSVNGFINEAVRVMLEAQEDT